jgi:hypothetical protein
MDKKRQFWAYIVTLDVKVSAPNREEAKQIVNDNIISFREWPSPIETIVIRRVKPVAK